MYINDKQILFLIIGMTLSSIFSAVILWQWDHFIQCIATIILLTVTHLMSSFSCCLIFQILNNQLSSQSFGDFSIFIIFVFFHVMCISQSSFWRYFVSLDARLWPRLCNILYVVIMQPILATFWIGCTSGVRVNGWKLCDREGGLQF